jgi:hypothetical protein
MDAMKRRDEQRRRALLRLLDRGWVVLRERGR